MKTTLLSVFVLFFVMGLHAQQRNPQYVYPVKPGTPAWAALKSHDEKVAVCQIPNDRLKNMRTRELLAVCLDYPLLLDVMVFSSLQEGFDKYRAEFNGIREYLQRPDAASTLTQYYGELNPLGYKDTWTPAEKGKFAFHISFTELFLAQAEVLAQLNTTERKHLTAGLLDKLNRKTSSDVYSSLSYLPGAYCLARIVTDGDTAKNSTEARMQSITQFARKGSTPDADTFNSVIQLSTNFKN